MLSLIGVLIVVVGFVLRFNPLLVVKVLMGHERIETTDRYLRAIAVDAFTLKEVLDTLLSGTT